MIYSDTFTRYVCQVVNHRTKNLLIFRTQVVFVIVTHSNFKVIVCPLWELFTCGLFHPFFLFLMFNSFLFNSLQKYHIQRVENWPGKTIIQKLLRRLSNLRAQLRLLMSHLNITMLGLIVRLLQTVDLRYPAMQ